MTFSRGLYVEYLKGSLTVFLSRVGSGGFKGWRKGDF